MVSESKRKRGKSEMSAICPLCKKKIDSLIEYVNGTMTYSYDGEGRDDGSFEESNSFFVCPKCDGTINLSEGEAGDMFNSDEEDD